MLGTDIDVALGSTHDAEPDVARLVTTNAALLVYRTRIDVNGVRLGVPSGTGAPVVTNTVVLQSGTFFQISGVAISKSGGGSGRHVACWSGQDFGGTSLVARTVDQNLNLLGSSLNVVGPSSAGPGAPDIDGHDFMVAWTVTPSGSTTGRDVFGRVLHWDGGAGQLVFATPEVCIDDSAGDQSDVAIGDLGAKFLVVWQNPQTALLESDMSGIAVDPSTCLPCGQRFDLPRPGTMDLHPAIATQTSGAPPAGNEALLTFTSVSLSVPFAGEIRAQRFEALGSGMNPQNLGGGCGGPFQLTVGGPVVIGNRGLVMQIDGVLGATAAFLSVGFGPYTTIPCGSCTIVSPVGLLTAELRADRAAVPFGITCDPQLIGGVLDLQWWLVGSPQPFCPIAPVLTFSDILRVQIDV